MDKEVYGAILNEWGPGGGLARCLAGEEDDMPVFSIPVPSRVAQWREYGVSKRWAAYEDQVLFARYFSEGCNRLLTALPGRSKEAIKTRARRLGVQPCRKGRR